MSQPVSRTSLAALLGAAAAAIGASVCCVVPLALVLLGVSGAWITSLTALEAWRPWLSVVALVCLAWAFWASYGPASRCRDDGICADTARLRRRRWLWFATLLITLLLLFPYYIGWFL
ncbi:mercuric transporter MerT family protein [Lysobacter hankyongensis]|jgi:mercuric ion transport protein|uniref:Mercuric transport protein MerT n=1 Tax=Lysobacter hankyongensis TaxID=1176535 RepID=A0ABP9AM66_9GAMM